MAQLIVNGHLQCGDDSRNLLDFLREDLRLTAAKNGCGQGACGTCSVLVEGVARRACTQTLGKLDGKQVVTVEGLSPRERAVYAYAFTEAGAVQCGFCIPGMVIAAKGLLDKVPQPTALQVKKAIQANICRCTGYIKIEKAILLAADLLQSGRPVPNCACKGLVGEDMPRLDAPSKTLGTGLYAEDVFFDGMLHASALRSAHPRARVLAIDTRKARAHPGCVAVYTATDVPGNNKIGHVERISDWDVMIPVGAATRYVGDALAVVVAEKREQLEAIKALVEVRYQVLPPLTTPKQALAPDAPKLHEGGNLLRHEHIERGNVEEALAKSKHTVTQRYTLPFTEHAFMEPECAIALPDKDSVLLYSASQSVFDDQREVARMLGLPREKVRVKGMLVGGAFGGKEDISVQHHAALAAWHLKRPVKVRLSREESMRVHPKRHAMELEVTTGCDAKGNLTALKAIIVADTGAYASLGGGVLQRCCTHAGGPYVYQAVCIDGMAVYTNNPPGGAFRGFGVAQSAFAVENNLNLLALRVGISPWDIRMRNAVRPGNVLANGQIADGTTDLTDCLLAVKDFYENATIAGIACAYKSSGGGNGAPDVGRARLEVRNGRLHICSGAACIGQGIATVLQQMVCDVVGLPSHQVVVDLPDTNVTIDTGTTTGSRQTFFTGEANCRAALLLRKQLDKGLSLTELEGQVFEAEYCGETQPQSAGEHPLSHLAYGYAAQVVTLDELGKLQAVNSAFDVGQVINPKAAQGQVEGGIVMGLGYALTEDFPLVDCVPTAKYATLGLWRSGQVPPMELIFVRAQTQGQVACGAKGLGELATIPTAPAVSGAYLALDGILRTKLPMDNTAYRGQPLKY